MSADQKSADHPAFVFKWRTNSRGWGRCAHTDGRKVACAPSHSSTSPSMPGRKRDNRSSSFASTSGCGGSSTETCKCTLCHSLVLSGGKRGSRNAEAHAACQTASASGRDGSSDPQHPRSCSRVRKATKAERTCRSAEQESRFGKGGAVCTRSDSSMHSRARRISSRPSCSSSFIQGVCAIADDTIAIARRVAGVAACELLYREVARAREMQQPV